jgi:hypothetical protein
VKQQRFLVAHEEMIELHVKGAHLDTRTKATMIEAGQSVPYPRTIT